MQNKQTNTRESQGSALPSPSEMSTMPNRTEKKKKKKKRKKELAKAQQETPRRKNYKAT